MGTRVISLQDAVRIKKDVVFRELSGEAVLLNLHTGTYFGLNEVGTAILGRVQTSASLREILGWMQEHYDAPAALLERDLLELIEQMREKSLVEVESGSG